ncbi:MAG: hypothetical protein FWH22_10660, partial [Fibromonadales bacterium]|nr:hypothetical protein [Fibromonadales bacterium]
WASHGAALGIKNNPIGESPNLGDCNAISYHYKGAEHSFQAQFPMTLCGASAEAEDDGSNKWGIESITASPTAWTHRIINISSLSLYNAYAGSACAATDPGPVDLSKSNQIVWELNNGLNFNQTVSLMITNVVCLTGQNNITPTAPSNAITITSGWVLTSSSSGSGTSSSSDSETSSSSGNGTSSQSNAGGSSSSNSTSPIITAQFVSANGMQLIKNGVSLQVKNTAKLELFNLRGEAVKTMRFSSGAYSMQFADVPKGLYIAKVSFGSERKILRIPVN